LGGLASVAASAPSEDKPSSATAAASAPVEGQPLSATAAAATVTAAPPDLAPNQAAPSVPHPARWYLYSDQGYGNQVVPLALRTLIDHTGAGSKDSALNLNVGLLGAYWRIGHSHYLLGGQWALYEDSYNPWQGRQLYISQSYLALSSIRYFGPDPCAGFFFRADAGPVGADLVDGTHNNTLHSTNGWRFQCAAGYALPLGQRHRASLRVMINNIVETDDSLGQSSAGDEVRVGLMF
jgi:hypothetical protein